MVEDQHQVVGIAVAVRAVANGADSAVVAFEGSVGQVVACPGDHTIDVPHQHVVELDEWGEPRPVEQSAPSFEEFAHTFLRGVGVREHVR